MARTVATSRSASSRADAGMRAPRWCLSHALDAAFELLESGIHDHFLGLAAEHAEHADGELDLERVRHRGGAVTVVDQVVRAVLRLLRLARGDQVPLDVGQVVG